MEHRLGRTVRVFLVVLATAGLYRLAVVPWVEPRYRETVDVEELTPEQAAAIRARADRRLEAVRELFPPGAWEHEEPIVMESRGMRLLFKQYHSLPDGRVNLVPCTVIVLPDGQRRANAENGRTVLLRAPQGAVLEFDEPLDLRAGRLARLVGGSLRGQVTIRGTQSSVGANDDIELVTRDLELDEYEIHTNEKVDFRFGRSVGKGRGLVATLLPSQAGGGQGPNIGGVDTIRLEREVELRLEGLATGVLPGSGDLMSQSETDEQPVMVRCDGGLTANLSANVITLEDAVEVRRGMPEQGGDNLSCDVLALVLGETDQQMKEGSSNGLEVVEIQASGSPVRVQSISAGLEVRAGRLGYELRTGRILLDGEDPVSIHATGVELEAKSVDYTPGQDNTIGSLMAIGPGWLRAMNEEQLAVESRWQKWLRIRPDDTGHVASLSGQAEVSVDLQGRLTGAEMHFWFEQTPAQPTERSAANRLPKVASLNPLRMLVRGVVEVEVPEVAARTDRMEIWFRRNAELQGSPQKGEASEETVADEVGVRANAEKTQSVVGQSIHQPIPAIRPPVSADRKLLATGNLIRGLVVLSPNQNELQEMSLEGEVQLLEQASSTDKGEPRLKICGDQLQLTRPSQFDAKAVVSGRPAIVQSDEFDLEGPLIEFDRGQNRVAVDGGGQLTVPVAGEGVGLGSFDLLGAGGPQAQMKKTSGIAEPLVIAWQGRMDFNGQTARFIDRVQTASGGVSLQAGLLDCIFTQPVDFSRQQGAVPSQQTDIAQIKCGDGVQISSTSEVDGNLESREKLFVRALFFDRLTGDVRGTGPGRLTSTRRGEGGLPMGTPGLPGQELRQPPAILKSSESPGVTFLGVDFQRGFTGNMNQRQMEFQQRVETIWGPVDTWDASLDLHDPGGLAEKAIAVTSDTLGIGQAPSVPGVPGRSVELSAGGNVLVEGDSFTARSARLSFSEMKDLLVFEGDGRSDAQLFRQDRVGGPTSSASAGKILYWRKYNRVEVKDARYLDLDQIGGANMPQIPR